MKDGDSKCTSRDTFVVHGLHGVSANPCAIQSTETVLGESNHACRQGVVRLPSASFDTGSGKGKASFDRRSTESNDAPRTPEPPLPAAA